MIGSGMPISQSSNPRPNPILSSMVSVSTAANNQRIGKFHHIIRKCYKRIVALREVVHL